MLAFNQLHKQTNSRSGNPILIIGKSMGSAMHHNQLIHNTTLFALYIVYLYSCVIFNYNRVLYLVSTNCANKQAMHRNQLIHNTTLFALYIGYLCSCVIFNYNQALYLVSTKCANKQAMQHNHY